MASGNMTTIPAAASRATPGGLAPDPRTGSTAAPPAAKTAKTAMPAVVLDLSASAKAALESRPGPHRHWARRAERIRLADLHRPVLRRDRRGTHRQAAQRLSTALKAVGCHRRTIDLKLDTFGKVRTDSPYKAKIEKTLRRRSRARKEFKEAAGLNAIEGGPESLGSVQHGPEGCAQRGRAGRRLWALRGAIGDGSRSLRTMTLEDGKLRSWSLEFMARSTG